MNVTELTMDTNILSLGGILGTSGSKALIDNINQATGGASFFGSDSDPFRQGFTNFISQVVTPIREAQQTLMMTASAVLKPNRYRPITSLEELDKGIPPCMMLSVLYQPDLKKMLDEERIDGFGIDPKTLMDEDPFAGVLENGYVEIHSSMLGPKGEYTIKRVEATDDPPLSADDVEALRETRHFIALFVRDELTKALDFTNYPNLHF